jgi:prevent-host-death family protein
MTISANPWNVARAKATFSELLREAAVAPQIIENRGREVAVVLSLDEYRRLSERAERTNDDARMREFLGASAELRRQGGAELDVPARTARSSPFDRPRKRVLPRRPPGR